MARRTKQIEGLPPLRKRSFFARWTWDRVTMFLVFLGLPLVIYVVLVVSPFIQAIGYSFTNWGGFTEEKKFVGLQNYQNILGDDVFRKAMVNNTILAIFLPLIIVVLSLALATLITVAGRSVGEVKGLRGAGFYRVVSFFPYAIPAIVTGLMWGQIFDPSAGLVNGILGKLGLHSFDSFAWLGNAKTAMPVTMFIIIWGLIGFYMVLFIAAIKSIPAEVFEAARIDGAGRLTTALRITVPLIRDNVQTAFIYLGIMALDAYVYMQALNPFGGPDNSTLVMAQEIYTEAFSKSHFGAACAMGVILALMTCVFAALIFLINWVTGGRDRVTMA